MANETRVFYKAIADFSAVARAARAAKAELAALKAEEAALNASSVKGAGAASAASDKHTKSVDNHTNAVSKNNAALKDSETAAKKVSKETEKVATVAGSAARALEKHAAGHRAVGRDSERAARGLTNANKSSTAFGRGLQRLGVLLFKTDAMLDKLGSFRLKAQPTFLLLIPGVAALLGLINPLVAGLGAVSVAALGFGASLGRLSVSALGAIPSLIALLSAVFAVKTAVSGIGGAFKAFGAKKTAAGGGGGGGGGGAAAQAEITQAEKLARAQESLRRATQDVQFAEDDLDQARKDYIKRLVELQRAVDRAAMSEARAAANSQLAKEDYFNVLADPGSTKGQKMDATVSVDEATASYNDTLAENAQNQADLLKMQQQGIDNDRQVIQATRAVTDAINAQRDAQIALINAQRGTGGGGGGGGGGAADEYAAALAKLSPSARKFVELIVAMDEIWTQLKKNVQEAFFSQFVDDVDRLRNILPSVESLLVDTAGAVGRIADNFLKLITSPQWQSDLILIGKQNVPILENVGAAMLSLLDATKDLAIAAGPFTEAITKGWAEGAKNLRDMIATARGDGSLAAYLTKVGEAWKTWWQIIKNTAGAIYQWSAAAGDFGTWLAGGLEKLTGQWKKAGEDARRQGSPFQKYLEDVKPLLVDLRGLFGDFFRWFAKVSGDPQTISGMRTLIDTIRNDLGPALGRILKSLSDAGAGDALAKAIASVAKAIATLLENGGAAGVATFWDTVSVLFSGLNSFLRILPTSVLEKLVWAFMALAALRFTGLSNVLGWMGKALKEGTITRFTGEMTAAQTAAAVSQTGAQRAVVPGSYSTGTYVPLGQGAPASAAKRAVGVPANSTGTKFTGVTAAPQRALPASGGKYAAGAVAGASGISKIGAVAQAGSAYLLEFAIALGVASVAAQALSHTAELKGVDDGVKALTQLANSASMTSDAMDAMFQDASGGWGSTDLVAGVNSLGTAMSKIADPRIEDWFNTFGNHLLGLYGETEIVTAQFGKLDEALTQVDETTARAAFSKIAMTKVHYDPTWTQGARDEVLSAEALIKMFPEYKAQLDKTAHALGVNSLSAQEYSDWMGGKIPDAIKRAVASMTPAQAAAAGYTDALDANQLAAYKAEQQQRSLAAAVKSAGDAALAASGSEIGYQQALSDMEAAQAAANKAISEGQQVFDKTTGQLLTTTQAGRDFQTALNNLASAGKGTVQSMADMGVGQEELDAKMQTVRDSFILQQTEMGISQAAAELLADKYKLIPGTITTNITAQGNAQVAAEVAKVNASLATVTPEKAAYLKGIYQDYGFYAFKAAYDRVVSKAIELKINTDLIKQNGKYAVQLQMGHFGGAVGHGAIRRASGGDVPGGPVPGSGNSDKVPAMLMPGEFVIQRAIVNRIGMSNLAKLNKGVMSYAELLKLAADRKPGARTSGVSMFGGGGLVTGQEPFGGFGGGTGTDFKGLKSAMGGGGDYNFGDIHIYYPAPEPASDTLPRSLRKVAYVGSRSRSSS